MALYSAKHLFQWPLKTWEWNISGCGALPDECCTSRMEREQSFQNQPCGLGASVPFSEGASTWKTGVQETALKMKLWFPHHLRHQNIDRGPGLEADQIPSCGGKERTLSPFLWDREKTNLPMILWIQSILLWSSSWSHEWGADFHLHTPQWYPLTLIKLHFYTGARKKSRLFLSGITDFFHHRYPGKQIVGISVISKAATNKCSYSIHEPGNSLGTGWSVVTSIKVYCLLCEQNFEHEPKLSWGR